MANESQNISVGRSGFASRVPDLGGDAGQDLAEYAILIGLIALVVVGAVTAFGGRLVAMYDYIVATLPFG